jgi:AraC-like DNA-binding protein
MKNELPGITTYYPQHPLLKKHIQYYYFMQSDNSSLDTSYYVFPNTNISLNIHKNVSHSFEDNRVGVAGNNGKNKTTILMGMRELPVLVNLKGCLDKITIVFHPLGFNHFIKEPYLRLAQKPSQLLTVWNDDEAYKTFLKNFYHVNEQVARIQLLEQFFISRYRPIPAMGPLNESIRLLSDFDEEKTIAQIAMIIGMPGRTFCRRFYREVGISPVKFKKIARFRHSLQNKLFNARFERFTEIGYASNFYDQAYFINIYKQLTNKNPTAFFREVNQLANDNLVLSFIQRG